MQILITNPEIDALTRYLVFWSNQLTEEISDEHTIYHLKRGDVKRKTVESYLKKKSIDLVLFNGHGTEESICGDENEEIINLENLAYLKRKTVHSLTCNSAKTLGKKAVENGTKTFVGYKKRYLVMKRDDKTSNPLADSTAKLFLDPAFKVQKALINGKSGKEAVEIGRKEYARSINKALLSPTQSDDDQFVKLLLWDLESLTCYEREV